MEFGSHESEFFGGWEVVIDSEMCVNIFEVVEYRDLGFILIFYNVISAKTEVVSSKPKKYLKGMSLCDVLEGGKMSRAYNNVCRLKTNSR